MQEALLLNDWFLFFSLSRTAQWKAPPEQLRRIEVLEMSMERLWPHFQLVLTCDLDLDVLPTWGKMHFNMNVKCFRLQLPADYLDEPTPNNHITAEGGNKHAFAFSFKFSCTLRYIGWKRSHCEELTVNYQQLSAHWSLHASLSSLFWLYWWTWWSIQEPDILLTSCWRAKRS